MLDYQQMEEENPLYLDLTKKIKATNDLDEKTDLIFQFWLANRGHHQDFIKNILKEIKREGKIENNHYALGMYYYILGFIKSDSDSYEESMEILNQALEEFTLANNKWALSNTINAQGVNYVEKGAMAKGLEKFLEALELAEFSGDLKLVKSIACNIGNILISLKQYEQALEYLMKYEDIDLEVPSETAIYLCMLAKTFRSIGDLKKAEQKALESMRVNPGGIAEVFALQELGYIRLKEEKDQEAEEYFRQCLQISRNKDIYRFVIVALIQLGMLERKKDNLVEALSLIDEALQVASKIKSSDLMAKSYLAISKLYADLGEAQKGYQALKIGKKLENEVYVEEMGNSIGALKVQQARQEDLIYKNLYNRINTISKIGQEITSNLDNRELGPIVYEHLKNLVPCDHLTIFLFSKKKDALSYKIYSKEKTSGVLGYIPLDMLNEKERKYLDGKKAFLSNNISSRQIDYKGGGLLAILAQGTDSFIFSPLSIRNNNLGFLAVQSKKSLNYTEHHLDITNALAAYTAIALENGQLFLEVNELATRDYLTGLDNRRKIFKEASEHFAQSKRYNLPMSLVTADLDRFKYINDNFGHDAGDIVLKSTAKIFLDSMRETDLVGRIGGEEFLFILPNTYLEETKILLERLIERLREKEYVFAGKTIKATSSFGACQIQADDLDIFMAIKRADEALYEAKRAGGNQLVKGI